MSTVIPPPPKVGSKFRDRFGIVHHVRSIVDHDKKTGNYIVVFRYWGKARWAYCTETCWSLAYELYTPVKKTKKNKVA